MKIKILQENFSSALNLVSRFASAKAQLPVLSNIYLKASKTKLTVSATNLEVSAAVTVGIQVEEEGELTVPAKTLTEIIGNLSKGTVTLADEKEILSISTEGFKATIAGMNPSDFPQVPSSMTKDGVIQLSKEEFSQRLSKVLFATAQDELRPILTGVLFILEGNSLSIVATDGYRLSQEKLAIKDKSGAAKLVIPKNVLSELSRLNDGGDTIQFSFKEKEKQVLFGVGDTILSSRILEGEFPPYEKIIPKSSSLKVITDKQDLMRSVKLASIFARESGNVVKIKVNKGGLVVTAQSQASGKQSTEIEAKVEGESKDFEIAFNYRYLEDVLNAISSEDVEMSFTTPDAAGVFKDTKDKDFLHLIMPVKIQG